MFDNVQSGVRMAEREATDNLLGVPAATMPAATPAPAMDRPARWRWSMTLPDMAFDAMFLVALTASLALTPGWMSFAMSGVMMMSWLVMLHRRS